MPDTLEQDRSSIAVPNYSPTKTEQLSFGGGLDAVSAPHLVAPDAVASTTNIDYSLEWGGAPVRRGCIVYGQDAALGTDFITIAAIGRNYALSTGTWSDAIIPWYMCGLNGVSYTGSGTILPLALSSVTGYNGGSQTQVMPQITQYQNYAFIANGTSAFRTNGTNTFDWLLPQADTPTVTFFQQGTLTGTTVNVFEGFNGTFTATEGSVVAVGTTTQFTNLGTITINTLTTGTGSRIVAIGTTGTLTNWENPFIFITLPTGTVLTAPSGTNTYTFGGAIDFHTGWPSGDQSGASGPFNGTATITQTMTQGVYGSDYMLLSLTDQQSIVSITRDLSIGDTNFTNYWSYTTTPTQIQDATTDPLSLMLAGQGSQTIVDQTFAINQSRVSSPAPARSTTAAGKPIYRKSISKVASVVSLSPWGVARSDYAFVGTLPTPDFTNIQAIRITIEYNTTGKQAVIGGCATFGAVPWCLNDQLNGIQYYQTFARVENGLIVAEGAPSVPTPAHRAQYAIAGLVCANNTNTTAGITHRVFYRTGGLLQDAYRVGSCTITSGTATIWDYANPDMKIITNPALNRFVWSTWPGTSAGIGLPGVNAVSESWNNRLWIGVQSYLYWTAPGQPTVVQDSSQTTVGDVGDVIQAIIPYTNLVIVTRKSVFEMAGTIFEGPNQDWSIQKSGARRGCAAPKTCIKTPYGILLFSYDGISMYRAGYGIDQSLDWVYEKIGDLWKGTAASDPAQVKGRIPSINQAAIFTSCAAYMDGKIYLAVPTGSNPLPDTVFVIDMAHQKIWMYQYPFSVTALFWDVVGNRMMAGTSNGTFQQIETGLVDKTPANVTNGISWQVRTRSYSTPTNLLLENLQIEAAGTWTASATVDTVGQPVVTVSNTKKAWYPGALNGTIGNAVYFVFNGTQSGTQQEVNQMMWDFIPQAPQVTFFKSDYITVPSQNYIKTWLFEIDPIATTTVTATLLVDGVAATLDNGLTSFVTPVVATTNKKWYEIGLANITSGKEVQAVYVAAGQFKYYNTRFEFEPKPFEKKTWLVTYKKIGGATQADMARFYAMDIEGTLTATVTSTWLIDGKAFTTNTFTISATNSGEGGPPPGVGRIYADQIPFPPGARGYLFQQQLTSQQAFRVWKAHVDIDRIGVKGLSRVTLAGTPTAQG